MNRIKLSGRSPHQDSGYALITVLMLLVLIATVTIGLFVLVRDDRTRARSYMEVGRSRFLLDMATQEVLAKIMDGSKVPWENGKAAASFTAAPGVIEMRKYKEPINKGYHVGAASWQDPNAWARNPFAPEYEARSPENWKPANPLTIPLYSRRWFAPSMRYMTSRRGKVSDGNPDYNPARVFNINTPKNPYTPGSLYLSGSPDESVVVKDFEAELGDRRRKNLLLRKRDIDKFRFQPGEAAVDRPLNVQWMPVYKFAGKGPTFTDERGLSRRNPIVGRYAYWVDVENTKVNINVADRKFVDSELATVLGDTEALNPKAPGGRAFYFIQNPNVRDPSSSDSVRHRGTIEGSLMNAVGNPHRLAPPPRAIINSNKVGRGDNSAAVAYYDLWMNWREDGTPPYLADNSLVDWRAFTGLRPLAGGLGERTSVEGLLADAAANDENRFNTFGEVYSLLDPKAETQHTERGLAALTAMRRTFGNAATIYGWDEERDPLGRPKIDIVRLQNEGVDGPLFRELLERLKDPDYYLAYNTGADPKKAKSFLEGYNPLVGDNDPKNDSNGEAAVRQMLVNIVDYGKKHTEEPYLDETQGIIGAKSMPYVNEIATRVRNGLWRLYEPEKKSNGSVRDNKFDTMASDFAQKVEALKQAVTGGNPAEIDQRRKAIIDYRDAAGLFAERAKGKTMEEMLTAVTVDLNAGMTNPNPFANKSENPDDPASAYFKGTLKLHYEWHDIVPVEAAETDEAEFEGLYVARSIPVATHEHQNPKGIRVDGESVYFDLGLISGEVMHDPTQVTALRIAGWEINREGAKLFHKVPLRHLGQNSEVRPWWAMAQPESNPGMMFSRGHGGAKSGTVKDGKDTFSLVQYYQPYNVENNARVPWQWLIPNVPLNMVKRKPNKVTSEFPYQRWKNVSVGWFTARTIAEHCRSHGSDVVKVGLPGCLYVPEKGWEAFTTEWDQVYQSGDTAAIQQFLQGDGAFSRTVRALGHIANSVDLKLPAMVERVVSLDPTLGHRTGNPDAFRRANGGHFVPRGLPQENVGHFYGTNGHSWRHGTNPPGGTLSAQSHLRQYLEFPEECRFLRLPSKTRKSLTNHRWAIPLLKPKK